MGTGPTPKREPEGDASLMQVRWFGQSWNASVCLPNNKVDIPVGTKCLECNKKITERDRGLITACSGRLWGSWQLAIGGYLHQVCSYHLACFLELVVGGQVEDTEVERRMRGATSMVIDEPIKDGAMLIEEQIADTAEEEHVRGRGWR